MILKVKPATVRPANLAGLSIFFFRTIFCTDRWPTTNMSLVIIYYHHLYFMAKMAIFVGLVSTTLSGDHLLFPFKVPKIIKEKIKGKGY